MRKLLAAIALILVTASPAVARTRLRLASVDFTSGAPPGTRSFALTLVDSNAPTVHGLVHWVAYDIPATRTSISAGSL